MIGELRFKGARNYLHGTDIFNAAALSCVESFGDGFLSHLEFRHFTDTQVRLTSGDIDAHERKIGSCAYQCASGEVKNLALVATAIPVRDRYDYDEQRVVAASRIETQEKVILSPSVQGVSAIEQIVALDKKLHYSLCPSPAGRWVFTRIQCSRALPKILNECQIKVDRMLPNKFSESTIEVDGNYIGKITFTVAPL